MRTIGPYTLEDSFFPFFHLSQLRFWNATRRLDDQTRACLIALPRPDVPALSAYDDWREELQDDVEEIRAMQHEAVLPLMDFGIHDGIPVVELQSFSGTTVQWAMLRSLRTIIPAVQIVDQLAAIPHPILSTLRLKKDAVLLVRPHHVRVVPPFRRILRRDCKNSRERDGFDDLGRSPFAEAADIRTMVYHLGSILYSLVSGDTHWIDDSGSFAPLHRLPGGDPQMDRLKDLIRSCMAEDPDHRIQTIAQLRERLELLGSRTPPVIGRVIDEVLSGGAN